MVSIIKEISLGDDCRVARLAVLQRDVGAHPNSPVPRVDQGSNDAQVEDATVFLSEPAAAASAAGYLYLFVRY